MLHSRIVNSVSALIALIILGTSAWARAQTTSNYPSRPVRVIVPYPAGGTTDIVARGIAVKLSERWGQQFVIDNRGGASTMIGADLAAKSAPDGYTLLLATQTTLSINPQVFKQVPYDVLRDFAPITPVVYFPYVIAAHPSFQGKPVADLIALAKAKPGSIGYGTPGTASTNHVAGALLETMAGIKLLHVPFKGAGPALTATLGGEVPLVITGIATVLPHVKTGRARILAFCAEKRHPSWPDIPSTGEAGLKGYDGGTWFSVVTRAGTSPVIVSALNKEIIAGLSTPDLKERFTAIGFDIRTSTPDEFARFIKEDMARVAKVIKSAGIKAE
ncbi:MAG TPA: tripartite tricarboxylate transporter substrate binding protein [Burkholderiales bacterium]|nr:tripartite tricarboxylate transporter substrate binding protein [Burkholderiales bacterium]